MGDSVSRMRYDGFQQDDREDEETHLELISIQFLAPSPKIFFLVESIVR